MTTSIAPALQVTDLAKSFGNRRILDGISLSVAKNEVVALLGPSGSGKSTLLRCIDLLIDIDGGEIALSGATIASGRARGPAVDRSLARRRMGYVSQEWSLWPNKTLAANIMEGPRVVLQLDGAAARKRAEIAAEQARIAHKLDAFPHELSGGEKQRGAIARALAMEPDLLMLDEVTSALDPPLVSELLDTIASLKSSERGLLIVTHHLEFARAVSDRAIFMDQGRVVEAGLSQEVLNRPRSPALQQFVRAIGRAR